MKTVIKNGHIVSDALDIENGYIVIEGKRIVEVNSGEYAQEGDCEHVVDAQGKYLLPGFIDIHLHGALKRHVGDGDVSSIETIAKWKMEEGVTTFCPSTVTMPEDALVASVESVKTYNDDTTYAKVAGMHLEGPFLNKNKLGGQNPRFIKEFDAELVKKLQDIYDISIVSFAPELEGAEEFSKQLIDMGIISSCAHSAAGYHEIMAAKKSGLTHFTHLCNQMTGIHHRDVGAVGAALLSDDFTAELICDKIHLSPEMIQLVFKCKSLSKIMLVTDSNYLNGLPDGEHELRGARVSIKDGLIRVVGTDILSGSSLRMNVALKNIVEITQKPLAELIRTTGLNQAEMLGLKDVGKIEKGFIADIVLADDAFNIHGVWIDGVLKEGLNS